MNLQKHMISCVYLLLMAVTIPAHTQAQGNSALSNLWKGVGGKSTWSNTSYILFTVDGNMSKYLQDGRTFIINRKTGQARLEGRTASNENLVLLFNFKSGKLDRLSSNGKEVVDKAAFTQEHFGKVLAQLEKDASLLFLPTLLEKPSAKVGKLEHKIVNAEKLDVFSLSLGGDKFEGTILFNPESGLIKQLVDQEGSVYYVNGYKDIGGGLTLPTTFKNLSDSKKSTTFSVVASFEELEETKFTKL